MVDEGIEKSPNGSILLEELQSAASRAVASSPTSPMAWFAEARARLLGGRPTAAWRTAYDRAITLDAHNPTILEHYGRALAQTDERAAAVDMLHRAAALVPRDAEILTTLAEIALAEKNDSEACGLLNAAIAADALYGPAWATRAVLRTRHGDLRFAWADAETATKVGAGLLGESAGALVDLAARDTVRARTRLADVMVDVSSRGTIGVREGRALAAAFIAAGQMPRALDVLEAVRPRGPLYAATLRDPSFDQARREPRFRALIAPSQAAQPKARISVDDAPTHERSGMESLPANVAREAHDNS
jgi:Tfp pilus assembly protein PilF